MSGNKKEVWKDVVDYEGYYKVSSLGRVRSLTRKIVNKNGHKSIRPAKLLKPYADKDGYLSVRLSKKHKIKNLRVHRIVFQSFNGFLPEEINHLNAIKNDNSIENLQGCNRKENAEHASKEDLYRHSEDHSNSKLTNKDVLTIVEELKKAKITIKLLAKKYNVSDVCVQKINNGENWRRVTENLTEYYPISKRRNGFICSFNDEQIKEIRSLYKNGLSCKKIGEKFGKSRQLITDIVKGRRYSHVK